MVGPVGLPRETCDTDTNELPDEEKTFDNYYADPDYSRATIPRGQGQRRRRSRGGRGSRGRGVGNLVPSGIVDIGELAEDGTPLSVSTVKKRRGRPR